MEESSEYDGRRVVTQITLREDQRVQRGITIQLRNQEGKVCGNGNDSKTKCSDDRSESGVV